MLLLFPRESKGFSLFLTRFDKMFFDTTDLAATLKTNTFGHEKFRKKFCPKIITSETLCCPKILNVRKF